MSAQLSRRQLAKVIVAKMNDKASSATLPQSVAAFLVLHDMADQLDLLIKDIAKELHHAYKILEVEVTSAKPLTDNIRRELRSVLTNQTEATRVNLHERIDESLLGGLVAKTSEMELDLSIRSKLNKLKA